MNNQASWTKEPMVTESCFTGKHGECMSWAHSTPESVGCDCPCHHRQPHLEFLHKDGTMRSSVMVSVDMDRFLSGDLEAMVTIQMYQGIDPLVNLYAELSEYEYFNSPKCPTCGYDRDIFVDYCQHGERWY